MMTQGSLLDFVCGNEEDSCDEDCMRNIYLTSLMPLSQQPEGFGFSAPKYNNTGFKLRKTEISSNSPSSSPNLLVPYTDAPPQSNPMRLVHKNHGRLALREPPFLAISPSGASNKITIYSQIATLSFWNLFFCLVSLQLALSALQILQRLR
jgi:hypothetical protein